ncbi:MAG: hypothetical protein QOE94_258 [Mycobacterium sp.]|jgi:hypothetical protein|nr:hypothetical protein [Mycobacterium sp.]
MKDAYEAVSKGTQCLVVGVFARDYILGQWNRWEPVLASLREALDDLGLLEEAEKLDLRSPVQDYFNPVFSTGWPLKELESTND